MQAVIDFYGPTDFLQNAFAVASVKTPEAALIGGAILDNKDKAAKANPIAYVTTDDPPFLVVHGDADKQVPFNQSELLEAALTKANVPVTFHPVKGGGHGGFNDDRIGPMVTTTICRQHHDAEGTVSLAVQCRAPTALAERRASSTLRGVEEGQPKNSISRSHRWLCSIVSSVA